MSGRKFDAQVVLTPKTSPRGLLLQQYVLARVVTMAGIDLGLFDYDRHNSIYYFAMNHDEQIYLRYGGRDAEDANSYLDLNSIERALEAGLRQHALYRAGKLLRQARPAAFFPGQIASLKSQVIDRNRCVECHLIGDYLAQDLEKAGKLDKRKMLFPSPDLKRLGIHLDVPKGLVIGKVEGAAATAGLRPGDTILAFGNTAVHTFGDVQYHFGRLDRDAKVARWKVERAGKTKSIAMKLPAEWWYSDTAHRYWTPEPMLYFTTKPLEASRRKQLGLKARDFAATVDQIDPLAESLKLHALRAGDVILSVNGVTASPYTVRPELFLKLSVRAGDTARLTVLRDGQRMELAIKTHRQYFRKPEVE